MPEVHQHSDEKLVELGQAGDRSAIECLVRRYLPSVYDLCLRMLRSPAEAEDAVQETFASVFHNFRNFRREASFSTWVFRIATNKALDMLRRREAAEVTMWEEKLLVQGGSVSLGAVQGGNPEQVVLYRDRSDRLWSCVDQLSPPYRIVILLFYREGLSYEKIADILDIPQRTVETRLYRARRMLKAMWEKTTGGEGG